MVDHIFNGEQGVKVREKLNEVIDRTNALMGAENHGQQGGNPHGTTAAQVTQSNSDLGPNVQTALDKLDQRQSSDNSNSSSHANNKNNPHEVSAEQVPQSNAELGDNVQEALNDLHGSVVELVEMLPEKADLDHIDGMDTHIQLRRGTNPLEAWNDDLMVAELFLHYTKGQLWTKLSDGTMVMIGSQKFIEDAPEDGLIYGRKDGEWFAVTPTLVQDDKPTAPTIGSLWADTGTTGELYVWTGTEWVSMTGGGNGGSGGGMADNVTTDSVSPELADKGLVRFVDDEGKGEWRQPTTADVVAVGEEPILLSPDTFDTPVDQITNQQQANWYLYNSITGGEGSGGDVDLSDYATIEYVDQTEAEVLNAALKATTEGDAALQTQIDNLQEPDLDGYATEEYVDESIAAIELPDAPDLDGYATEEYVDDSIAAIELPDAPDLDGYATTDYVDGEVAAVAGQIPSLDGYATEDFVGEEINKIVYPEYDDEGIKQDLADETAARIAGDSTLQAEITELALAVDTLLVQQESGKWKYVGVLGDTIARNPGEFVLATDDLSSDNNIIQINPTDLDNEFHGFSDVKAGDYIEIVDADRPDDFVLFTCVGEASGDGITEIPVNLKKKGNNFLVNEVCEIRVFSINEQDLDITELDERYARKDHTHPEFAEINGEIEQLKEDLVNVIPPPPEPPPSADGDLEKAENGELMLGWLKSAKASDITSGAKYESGPKTYFAWPDEIFNADGSAMNSRKLSEISHVVIQEKNGYENTQSNSTLWYTENYGETLKPGDFVRFDYTSKSVSDHPSGKVDVTLIVGNKVHEYTMSNQKNFTFEVTEVILNKGSAETVHPFGDNLNDQYSKPYNHLYINTHASDYEREYVTPEHLGQVIEVERAITDSEIDSLQNQVDFMAQELNHLIPIKEEGSWKAQGNSSTKGVVKMGGTAYYGPWDEEKLDRLYFNNEGTDDVDHTEMLAKLEYGDKFECFINKNNYCLFKVTRINQYSSYTIVYVELLKYEGEGYKINDILTFEFFETAKEKSPDLAGYYKYTLAKIADQITKDTLHEHPGKFLCVDGSGDVVDNQYSTGIKFVYFAPYDAFGDRVPIGTGSSDSLKLKVWEIRTRTEKSGPDGNVVCPSYLYEPKTREKPFKVGQHYNQGGVLLPAIKIDADENWVVTYDAMGSTQYWKWPV